MTKKQSKKATKKTAIDFTSVFSKSTKAKSYDSVRNDALRKLNKKAFRNVSNAVDNALDNALLSVDHLTEKLSVYALDMIIAQLIEQRNELEKEAIRVEPLMQQLAEERNERKIVNHEFRVEDALEETNRLLKKFQRYDAILISVIDSNDTTLEVIEIDKRYDSASDIELVSSANDDDFKTDYHLKEALDRYSNDNVVFDVMLSKEHTIDR